MKKLKWKIYKAENDFAQKMYVHDCFDCIIEEEFNPDIVLFELLNCYAEGMHAGFIAATLIAAVAGATVFAVKKIKKHHDKVKES